MYELKLKQIMSMIEQQIKSTLGRELNVDRMLVQKAQDAELRKRNLFIYRFLCLIIILLGFALRVYNLGERSLWFDETLEYWVARSPLPDILPTVKIALFDPPLYSLLLHFWLKVGHTEFITRFLSLVFSVAGILGVIVLSRLSFGKKASLVAGILMAISVPDIRFAQEAGQYALMSFVLTWNLVFLYLLIKENGQYYGGYLELSLFTATMVQQ